MSRTASIIEYQTFNYIYHATDFGNRQKNPWSTVTLSRIYRSRDISSVGSLGPGFFINYDIKLDYTSGRTGQFFDPNRLDQTHSFIATAAYDSAGNVIPAPSTTGIASMMYQLPSGGRFYFQLLPGLGGYGTAAGRLTRMEDLDGRGTTITYKTWTAAEIQQSPSRQWQIDTITGNDGVSLTFTYGSQQVGGRWAVSSVAVSGGGTIQYTYANNRLSTVQHLDGTVATFSINQSPSTYFDVLSISDPAAEGQYRKKQVHLTTQAIYEGAFFSGETGTVLNQSSMLARIATVGSNNEVVFAAMSYGGGLGTKYIYEGAGTVKKIEPTPRTVKYMQDGWAFTLGGAAPVSGTADQGISQNSSAITDERNVTRTLQYNSSGELSRMNYGDGTFETWDRNAANQVLRYRDRMARVTKNTYDAKGHILTKEVGIVNTTGTTDVNQPEWAKYQWEYYPTGNPAAGLLKTSFDPLWDGTSTDTHRTDYEYNGNGSMTKKLGPASAPGQVRPQWNYTYDSLQRLTQVTDPDGHTVIHMYDAMNRVVRTTFDDGSTEENLYGAAGSGNEGLVVKTKDRRNVVTTYTFDSADRVTQVIVASEYDTNILDGTGGSTPITDRNQQSITKYTYEPGSKQPVFVLRDGALTAYAYDYRGRLIETRVWPYSGKALSSKSNYVNNFKFYDEDPYGRRTYYGYRASDGAMIRTVKGAYPTLTVANNAAVIALLRDTALNPLHVVKDMIQDPGGSVWQIVDERSTLTETTLDSRGQAKIQLAAKGTAVEAKTETIYDKAGNVLEIRSPRYFDSADPNGYQKCRTVMTYDGANRVLTRTEAPGTAEVGVESYTYDTSGRQKTRTDARGKVWTTNYASCCGHSVSSKNPLGHGSISNQNAGGLTVHTAGISDVDTHTSLLNPVDAKTLQETTTKYDALGRSVASTVWLQALGLVDVASPPIAGFGGLAGTQGLTTQSLYDADLLDNVGLETSTGISVTNPLGGTYNVSLAAAITKLGQPIAQGGAGITFTAGTAGTAVVNLNAENEVSFSINDAQGRTLMSGILHPHDAVTPNTPGTLLTWSCNVPDTTETISSKVYLTSLSVDALGNTTKSRSNGLSHTVQSVDQGGNISTVQYDSGGNAIVSRDPNNVGQDCVYDALGRRTQCTDTVGSLTQTGYDNAGQQITATDAKNKVTHYAYDARGRRWKETDRLTYPTEWSYDAAGNLLSLKDAENQITSYGYNDAGQRITEQYPDHVSGATIGAAGYGIITFGYDALGRRVSKQDQQGDTTSYDFDMSGRMLTRGYVGHASGPLAGQTNTDTFAYDRAGRMLSGIKGRYDNTVTFSYDDRGQQTQETLTTHGQTYTVGYQKNVLGQTTGLVYPDGSLVNRAYTNRGQLQVVNYTPNGGALSSVATFAYDAGGRETTRNLGNGLTTTRIYFADNQVQSIATPTVETLTYTYDPNKNPTSETRTGVMAPYSWTTGPTGYDDEDRLTNWQRTNGDSQTWNLSPVHDWNSTTINGAVQTRTHGPAHELLTMSGAQLTSSPRTLVHDVKGNMTTDDRGCNMAWDFDNMLQSFTANGVTGLNNATYEYDAIGRRVAKDVTDAQSQLLTVFVESDHQVVMQTVTTNGVSSWSQFVYGGHLDDRIYAASNTDNTIALRYFLT